MPGELVGLTAALADIIEPHVPDPRRGARLGVPETAKVPVAAAIAARREGPVLLLVPTPSRSLGVHEELLLYLQDVPLARLPEREGLPYEFARSDALVAVERARALAALRGPGRALVVASWAALAEHCGGPDVEAAGINVTVGATLDPGTLVSQLEEAGYLVEPLADRPGSVSRRGGLVDVFPANEDRPYRVEFFGNEVESIREVDLSTQRSIQKIDRVHFPPAATSTRHARDAARDLVERVQDTGEQSEAVIQELTLLAEGNRSDYEAFLEPLLYRTTALDHLSRESGSILFDDFEDGEQALARLNEYEGRTREELERRGNIPSGLPPRNIAAAELAALLSDRPGAVHLQRFGSEELGAKRLPLKATPSFAGKLRPLALQAAQWAKEGKSVVIASQQALRLDELMQAEGIHPTLTRTIPERPEPGDIVLSPAAITGGFTVDERLVLVSDAEVFGFRKRRRPTRTRQGIQADLVSTLEVGDYLVHADHGIARYGGLIRRKVDDVEREYLELQYAEGDRLYVPADQLEAVSRYVGPADHPPSLTRLGTQEWSRTKRRVKQAVAEMAFELLELYAKRETARGYAFAPDGPWQMEMEAAFPFLETQDQLDAIGEMKVDMERDRPMDRLICGDVGYGKTEVAVRGAFKAVADGKQVAVLVPTTVLAEQHGATFRERVAGFPIRVEVLSRFRSEEQQREIVAGIKSGEVDIVIGTHRLLQRDVEFKDLGLVVVDEEQRFGVTHKERLKQMRAEVDVLTLSATPIPRTLQMSLAGIRDMSTVMTPPEERLPIRTYVLQWDGEIIREAIDRELQRGGQVYFVHNRVHNIERVVHSIEEVVPDARIVVGHGQMPEEQLERVMSEFAAGDHDILVCTTIIESGLDIPNVNTIIINNANQLGLAQLYQLRGRVGRGANRAYAYLLYNKDRAMSEAAQKRLEAIFEASELGAGFQIALRDLEIRGAGNLLGAEQSGHIADVGFELYSKLVAEAVHAMKVATGARVDAGTVPLPPVPSVDLPLSAHIPQNYIDDIHARLAVYQRVANVDSAEAVAEMEAELQDRFGEVPPAVQNLLYVALVKSMARRANVESIKTDQQMFHLRVRGGTTPDLRRRVEGLGVQGILVGPNQVRIDRVGHARDWETVLVRLLRAMQGVPQEQPAVA
ncbi:MAG TPA: transcription-repair coupling factor [Tepidiformaceae bacterium]|nr:transcription-repair coupling factor [Tepidiformaceae bacterium]